MHALCQSQIAFVRQRRVHQLRCIALVFVRVIKLRVDHSDHGVLLFEVEAQLLLPEPVVDIAYARVFQLLNNVHVMHGVHNQCFVLQIGDETFDGIGRHVNVGVLLQDVLHFAVEFIQLTVLDRFFASFGKDNPFRQARNLNRRRFCPHLSATAGIYLRRVFLYGHLTQLLS